MDGFVEVLVTATGRTEMVPADWVGHPVLGVGIEKLPEPAVVEDLQAPTERDTHETIDAFAAAAGIALGDTKTKAEKLALISEVVGAAGPATPEPDAPTGNPDVQLVAGDEQTGSTIPAFQVNTNPDGTASSTETPANGDEEN